jgi:hypothetical protein
MSDDIRLDLLRDAISRSDLDGQTKDALADDLKYAQDINGTEDEALRGIKRLLISGVRRELLAHEPVVLYRHKFIHVRDKRNHVQRDPDRGHQRMEHAAYPARVRWRVERSWIMMPRALTVLCLLPLLAFGHWALDFDEDFAAASSKKAEPVTLTFEYVSTYPATITIGGSNYGQPADPSKALVDAGDGVFVPWTSNTITVKGKRIRFRGDWRNASGNFRELFRNTFAGGYNVTMSGGFDFEGAPAGYMFASTFYGCSNLTGSIPSGLFGDISGAPAAYMFNATFRLCSNLTGSIPSGLFGDISGAPAGNMFSGTFYNCSNLTGSIPVGLFGDISGAPAAYMFNSTFYNCSNLTDSIPVGLFGDISGAPAAQMFYGTFQNCSNLTGESALMPDGVTHLYDQFPTASGTQCDNCYFGATKLSDYATMPAAWK